MLIGIDINATKEYVSKLERCKDNPTVFRLGVLDPALRAEIDDESSIWKMSSKDLKEKPDIKFNWSSRQLLAVKFGLKGLTNFLDPQTKKPVELKFDTIHYAGKMREAVPERIIGMFSSELRQELAEEILNESHLSGDEEKN